MKKKTRAKTHKLKVSHGQINAGDELPVELKQFEGKSPAQILGAMHPDKDPESLVALLSGCDGLEDPEIPIPSFVKEASRQFWKYFFGRPQDLNKVEDRGAFAMMFEQLCKKIDNETTRPLSPFEIFSKKFGNSALNLLEKDARAKSAAETAKFFKGRVRGERASERMTDPNYLNMVKRAPIYYAICYNWKKFNAFTSQAEAERWLRAEKVIGDRVSSREVSAVLKGVGMPSRGRPGRPKNSKT